MSETKLKVSAKTVKQLKLISEKFGILNTGSTSNEFWLGMGATGDYSWTQYDLGVNKAGQLIVCQQSGCSCNGPEQPTPDETFDLKGRAIEISTDWAETELQDAINDLTESASTLYKVLTDANVSPKEIIALPNSEVRRAVVELMGYDKIVSEAESLDISETDGELLKIPLMEDEDIMLLHVKDPSTTREYFLRVPPNMKTARQARAWTFGFEPEDFVLEKET